MNTVGRTLAALDPAYFALAMATGIVSIAAHLLGMHHLADALFVLNLALYPVLALLYLARLVFFPAQYLADLWDDMRGPGYFTMAAGTCVLGTQFLILRSAVEVATVLWLVGIGLWLVVTYAFFTGVMIKASKPTLAAGLSPTWLLSVVAAQSVAVLGALLATAHPQTRALILFFSLAVWLAAEMLYGWIIALILYRCAFFRLTPTELAPPYWLNMGAMAISTLAGCELAAAGADIPPVKDILPFVKGLAILFWATATFWIPLLLALEVWKYGYARSPLRYDSSVWGAVFPLGMYTACSVRLAEVAGVPFLFALPRFFVYVAFLVWVTALLGLLWELVRPGPGSPPDDPRRQA